MKMFSFLRKKSQGGKKKDGGKSKTPTGKRMEVITISTKPPTMHDIPSLVETMLKSKNEKRAAAATKSIVNLSVDEQNRIPMVCSEDYNVLAPLVECLVQKNEARRALACSALSNLSIPEENKRVMALGPSSKDLIGGLCRIIENGNQERWVCLIALTNLSNSRDTVATILRHSPYPNGKEVGPLENPHSLLRVLEKFLANPHYDLNEQRRACSLIQNLTNGRDNATLIGKTQIPKSLLQNIRHSTTPPSHWKRGTLEKYSLYAIRNLGKWPQCRETLISIGTLDVMKSLIAKKEAGTFDEPLNAEQEDTTIKPVSDISLATTANSTVSCDDFPLGSFGPSSDASVATTALSTVRYDDSNSICSLVQETLPWATDDQITCWSRDRSQKWMIGVLRQERLNSDPRCRQIQGKRGV